MFNRDCKGKYNLTVRIFTGKAIVLSWILNTFLLALAGFNKSLTQKEFAMFTKRSFVSCICIVFLSQNFSSVH